MAPRTSALALCALCGALAGCAEKVEPPKAAALEAVDVPPHAITPLPDPDLQGGHVGRAPRRITVNQLARSIEVTTGEAWSQLEQRAPSLGRADYALVNQENTDPTLVFAKFLEDGAREVCARAAAADLTRAKEDRVLARELASVDSYAQLTPDEVTRNLVYLSTRFWGAALEGEELARWARTFEAAAARAEAIKKRDQALAAMCIALMTDARFVTY